MANLVTRTDFEKYVQLAELGTDARTLDVHVLNAQNIDVKQAIGNILFTDIEANTSSYTDLLNGGVYTYEGKDYSFEGLKAAIVMFAMARRRIASGAIDSPWGMVQKTSEFSQPVSSATRQQQVDEARSIAMAYLNECILFLKRNATDYPLLTNCCEEISGSTVRISPISRI